jgi:hypothetical protein
MVASSIRWLRAWPALLAFIPWTACGGSEDDVASGRGASAGVGNCTTNCPDGSVNNGDGWSSSGGGGAGGTGGAALDSGKKDGSTGGTTATGGTSPTGGSGGSGGAGETGGTGGTGCNPVPEVCDNGLDDDCDGQIDCADGDCAFKTCAADRVCKANVCVSVFVNAMVACNNSGQTGSTLCTAAGFQGCADSIGYWWFQCAGPGDCPTAWSGLSCSSYSSGLDCVGVPFNDTQFHTSSKGCGTAYGATDFGYDCASWNPGYTVRLKCK